MIFEKVKEIIDLILNIDEKIGFKKFLKYVATGLIIIVLMNYKVILTSAIELIIEIRTSIHNKKIELRDELLFELYPILSEFRSEIGADRILYFEFHNSKENLVSIPFKYVELVQQNTKYSVSNSPEDRFKNINTGVITNIYEVIKKGNVVFCLGENDVSFHSKYPGIFEFLNSRDHSRMHTFISIPGIKQPIGLIILEWLEEDEELINKKFIERISLQNYIPRINALILSKR